ncbi:MAG: DUF3078 domain-containing protein [Prolixibacteraceae bacterium]|nr:DUF3078 domain-containing protein [Prolixibacteraceae bacterium]
MKRFAFFLLLLTTAGTVAAQEKTEEVKNWKKAGDFSVSFSQVSFSNWAAGGKNSVSGVALFNYSANYAKGRMSWDNSLNMGYGLLKEQSRDLIKSEDKLELSSKVGYKMTESGKWFFTGLTNFRTQFADGFNYTNKDNPVRISSLLAPAYLTFAAGFDYKPTDKFSLFISPLGSKFTFVADDDLSAVGAFGVDPGKKFRAEMGGTLKSELKFAVAKNVDAVTNLNLFSNYLKNPQNIDVNWDFRLNMKVNKFLSANFITNLIYDDDILVPIDQNDDGVVDGKGRRVQLKQLFGAGLSFKF